MKTIKTLIAMLFLFTFFAACDADEVNEEVGIELEDVIGGEDEAGDEVQPAGAG